MTRDERDRKLGVLPLHESLCDDCSRAAYTRWYENHGTKKERVAMTLCEAHNFAFLKSNQKERARLGLTRSVKS